MSLTRLAPAKVNLFLHVGRADADGYHPLSSLAVFADIGDQVTAAPAERLSLTVQGPFAGALPAPADNSVLRALRQLGAAAGIGDPPLEIILDKRLPVASGLGGGNADAGAALRLAREALGLKIDDVQLERASLAVGSDGPLCLWSRAALVSGRGERLDPAPGLPEIPALLVNPGVESSTAAVYRAFDEAPDGSETPPAPPPDFETVAGLTAWLEDTRNDLEAPAVRLTPIISDVLAALSGLDGARFVRMSGSGATCFALFDTIAEAQAAAQTIARDHPRWWVAPTRLG